MNFRLAQGEGKFPRGHGGDAYRIRGVRLGGMVRRVEDLEDKAWRQGPGKGDFIILSAIPNLCLQGILSCALENKLLTAWNTIPSLVSGEGQDPPTGREVAQHGEAESGEPATLHLVLQTWTDVVTSTPQFRMEYSRVSKIHKRLWRCQWRQDTLARVAVGFGNFCTSYRWDCCKNKA